MEVINKRITTFLEVLKSLNEGMDLFSHYKIPQKFTLKNEEILEAIRDATIHRFKCCTALIWKVLKNYLEDIEEINIDVLSPRVIIRETVKSGLISESEGSELMNMVGSRNKIPYMYRKVVADDIANKIPQYYTLMQTIIDRIQKQLM